MRFFAVFTFISVCSTSLAALPSYPPAIRSNAVMRDEIIKNYKASCWDYPDFYTGKTKRRLHDRKTEHFKGLTSACHTSAIAEHVTSTGHNMKCDLVATCIINCHF